MSDYLIYVRKNSGICDKIAFNESSTIGELRRRLSDINSRDQSDLELYFKGIKLDQVDDATTVKDYGIPNNSILQLQFAYSEEKKCKFIEIQLLYNTVSVKRIIKISENIEKLREVASKIFETSPNSIQFEIKGTKIFNDSVRICDLQLKNGQKILIKDRKYITNLLSPEESLQRPELPLFAQKKKIRIVQSIASSDDPIDQVNNLLEDQDTYFKKQYRSQIVKKHSVQKETSSSLKKISEQQQSNLNTNHNKRSAIVSNNFTSPFLNSPTIHRSPYININTPLTPNPPSPNRKKSNNSSDNPNPLNLNQIRQTMSFGSLQSRFQEQNPTEITIQLYNDTNDRYYKLVCLPQMIMKAIKTKISQVQRVKQNRIQINGYQDQYLQVGQLYMKVEQVRRLKMSGKQLQMEDKCKSDSDNDSEKDNSKNSNSKNSKNGNNNNNSSDGNNSSKSNNQNKNSFQKNNKYNHYNHHRSNRKLLVLGFKILQ